MTDIKVRMDRGANYATVHGERAPDDKHATTHYVQDGLPFDAEGFLIFEHADFEAEKGDRCSAKAADLRRKAHVLIEAAKKKAVRRAQERRLQASTPQAPARRTLQRADTLPVPPPPTPAPARSAPPPETPSAVLQIGGEAAPESDEEAEETDIDADAGDGDNAPDTGDAGDDADIDDADDSDDDGDGDTESTEPNIEDYLRGGDDIQWHILTQLIARRFGRRVSNLEDALDFLVIEEGGPKVVPLGQLAPRFQKKLK